MILNLNKMEKMAAVAPRLEVELASGVWEPCAMASYRLGGKKELAAIWVSRRARSVPAQSALSRVPSKETHIGCPFCVKFILVKSLQHYLVCEQEI